MAPRGKQTISQRISLDGGAQIKKEFLELGAAGEKAFNDLQRASSRLNFGNRISAQVAQLRTAFAGLQTAGAQLSASMATVAIRASLLKVGVEAAAGALLLITKNAGAAAADIERTAQGLGISADKFQAFRAAAAESGVEGKKFETGLKSLSKQVEQAAATAKASDLSAKFLPALQTFEDGAITVRRFGPDFKNAVTQAGDAYEQFLNKVSKKGAADPLTTLKNISAEFKKLPDGAQKSAFALKLFGDEAGVDFVAFLNQGDLALEKLTSQMIASGKILTKAERDIGIAQETSLVRLGNSVALARQKFGLVFAPAFTAAANTFKELIDRNTGAIREFGLTLATEVLGVVADFKDALSGKDGEVERKWILDLRDLFVSLKNVVSDAINTVIIPGFKALREGAKGVADSLNSIFGTRFTGDSLLATAAILQLLGVFKLLRSAVGFVLVSFTALRASLLVLVRLVGWPALLVAGLILAAKNIDTIWPAIVKGAQVAFDTVVKIFHGDFSGAFEGLKGESVTTWAFVAAGAVAAFRGLNATIGAAGRIIGAALIAGIGSAFSTIGAGLVAATGIAGGPLALLLFGAVGLGAAVVIFWNDLKPLFVAGYNDFVAILQTPVSFEGIKSGYNSVIGFLQTPVTLDSIGLGGLAKAISDAFSALPGIIAGAFSALLGTVTSILSTISSIIDGVISRARAAASAVAAIVSGGGDTGSSDALGNAQPFAKGGLPGGKISGPGTGTSDSILARFGKGMIRVSNGEYIVREKMTRQWLPLLEMLNAGRLTRENLSRLLAGFSEGGRVALGSMRDGLRSFADGGLASLNQSLQGGMQLQPQIIAMRRVGAAGSSGGQPLSLYIGNDVIRGLIATPDAVEQLSRHASRTAALSMGTPGWKGR